MKIIKNIMKRIKIEDNKYNSKRIVLTSGDGPHGDYEGCKLNIAFWKYYITITLPAIVKPKKVKKVYTYNGEQKEYDKYLEKEYGISLYDNHVSIYYGVQEDSYYNEGKNRQYYGFFLPWGELRFIRHTIYNPEGEIFWEEYNRHEANIINFTKRKRRSKVGAWEIREFVSKPVFIFKDFDGEEITADCVVEEREWLHGVKWCKFLSLFKKPLIHRVIDISFHKEIGKRKGSWKGGTIGHSIEILPDETIEDAFKRYCQKYEMTYVQMISDGITKRYLGKAENGQNS